MTKFQKIFPLLLLGLIVVSPILAAEESPIKSADDIIKFSRAILSWVSTIFWIAAGIATLYGGFLYMTAAGDSEKVSKAKKQILYAVIAIVVGLMAKGAPALIESLLKARA